MKIPIVITKKCSRHFCQVFYFTHQLYWLYVILLIVHAPAFYKWILLPLLILCVEKIALKMASIGGKGQSTIVKGIPMASRVTKLEIVRPYNFIYNPGDWMFVRIPEIAQYEWHPFTISSAPERKDAITIHARAVGQWTNRLYEYFDNEMNKVMQ